MGLHVHKILLRAGVCGFFAAYLSLLASCGRGSAARVYLLDESRSVAGSLVSKNGFNPANVEFSIINAQGFREQPEQFSFDPVANKFSFNLVDEKFYNTQTATLMEQILSMGKALPIFGFTDTSVVGKVEKYVRLEVRPAKLSDEKYQIVPYLQISIPLTKRNLYAGNDVLQLGGGLELGKTGFTKLQVTNEMGVPLAGADVAAISDGKLEGDIPLWHNSALRPIFTKTDSSGVAFIGPIDTAIDLAPFQILARAEGYCNFLTAPSNKFSVSETKPLVVKLRPCSADELTKNSLLPSFPTGLKYLSVTEEGTARSVVHTNESSVFLRLDSSSSKFRGARVGIYETNSKYEPRPEPFGELREVPNFQGEFEIPIPKIFVTSDAQEGKFIIKVTRLPGALDGGQLNADAFPELIVYGQKSLVKPSRDGLMAVKIYDDTEGAEFQWAGGVKPDTLDYWKNFAVKSSTGFENIVPGASGGVFTLSSPNCKEGYELGFEIVSLSISKKFKPCVNTVATFTADEAGFVAKAAQILTSGGRQAWRIYIKDKFGNESEALSSTTDPDKQLNIMTVIIDTAPPLLGDVGHPLQNLEFVPDGATAPVFEVSRDDVEKSKLKFRFQGALGPEKICNQINSSGESDNANGQQGANGELKSGIDAFLYKDELGRVWGRSGNESLVGLQFVKFAIASSEAALASRSVSEFSACRKFADDGTLVPVEITLGAEHISFPNDENSNAEFYLRVQDASGQLSSITKYPIPPCSKSAPTCWKE
jgi:hypothetical protein